MVKVLRVEVCDVGDDGILCRDSSGESYVAEWEGIDSGVNFRYLCPYLVSGTRLNILAPESVSDGRVRAEYIIFDPDYLVDITTVAGCFESYGASPVNALLKHLKPEADSQAILLGNFAGELLDGEIHRDADSVADYRSAAISFFRSHALRILSTPEFNSALFHQQARQQQHNIRMALDSFIPIADREKMVLEPTFFCEVLGLQGRMDLISDDYTFLVEQKAGKGEGFARDEEAPQPRFPHLVQLLLYRAMLHYGYGVATRCIRSHLLYSRYSLPLVTPHVSRRMLFMALEMRNRYVVQEHTIAAPGGFDFFGELTADRLNIKGIGGRLWEQYQKPGIETLLSRYRDASPLEKEYVARLIRFTMAEHHASKTGYNELTGQGGFASAWNLGLDEKMKQGCISFGMRLIEAVTDHSARIEALRLAVNMTGDGMAPNFRIGDIVALYPHAPDETPDIRGGMVIRGTVAQISTEELTVRFRAPQAYPVISRREGMLWAIEPDLYESQLRGQLRNIFGLLATPPLRRRLILYPAAVVPATISRKGEYGEFNALIDKEKTNSNIFAIIGPPGTGKTSFGLMNVLREQLLDAESNVLLTAYTNRAVDEICGKLVEAGIDFLRLGHSDSAAEYLHPHMLSARLSQCARKESLEEVIRQTRVFVGTTHSFSGSAPIFKFKRFSLAIVDEASQILESQMLGLFCALYRDEVLAIERFVLIGDHKQLPAVVQQDTGESVVEEAALRAIGLTDCRRSFFERFLDQARRPDGSYDPGLVYTFTRQGRMHSEVALFSSRMYYGGNLSPVPLPHQSAPIEQCPVSDPIIGDALNRSRTIFFDVLPKSRSQGNVNHDEAGMVARIASEIHFREGDGFDPALTIGIIVPYRAQANLIREYLVRTGIPRLADVTIDTVERFQGGQRRYIIYSTVATTAQQLNFLTSSSFADNYAGIVIDRKLNVALTRAISCNIVVGNSSTLSGNPGYRRLISEFYFAHLGRSTG